MFIFFQKIVKSEKGIILLMMMLFSMMLLALGLTLLYQSEASFQLSSQSRDKVEVFMTAETAYESAVSRMLYGMNTLGYDDNFSSARPGNTTGWPNYLVRVYNDPNNPSKFTLLEQPTADFWNDDAANRDLSTAVDVTCDNTYANYYLINRDDSVNSADIFKIDDIHFYRVWLEADRHDELSTKDNTAFLMVEAFRGKVNAPLDPNDPNFLPQSQVLMQYRVRLAKDIMGWESEDDSQHGAGQHGGGASTSGGEIDLGGSSMTREITTGS